MRMMVLLVLIALVSTCAFAQDMVPPIPGLAQWEAHMKDNTRIVRAQPERVSGWDVSEAYIWYYDGIVVFHEIAQYTKDAKWLDAAAKCRRFYRDSYVVQSRKYGVDGWRNFTRGLYYDWTVLHDEVSRNTAIEMARKSRFSQIVHAANVRQWDNRVDYSREVAYSINAWHVARDLGAPEFAGRDPYLDTAYSHLDVWKAYLTAYPNATYPGEQTAKYQPFMFALTAEALIRVYERQDTSDEDRAKILTKIYDVAKLTYDKLYSHANHGFTSNTGHPKVFWGGIDLLVVPLYGWLWHVTGEGYFLDAGDTVWKNWIDYGWQDPESWGGKMFSQNYHWSFDYVRWRSVAPEPNRKILDARITTSSGSKKR